MADFGTCKEFNVAGISDTCGKMEAGEVIGKAGDSEWTNHVLKATEPLEELKLETEMVIFVF